MKIERLQTAFEIKALDDKGTFKGYGSVFGNKDSYNEIVAKGAFSRSLTEHKAKGTMPAMLWMHNPDQPIGVYTNVAEDDKGLAVEGNLALKTQAGAEAYELMKMNALSGLSIGYRVAKSQFDKPNNARVLTDLDLYEISPVTFPANDAARVSTVKALEDIKTIREFEEFLRDAGGFSRAAAAEIARSGFKARTEPRDEDDGLDELATLIKRNIAVLQPIK